MGTLDHINVVNKNELMQIYGGIKFSATLFGYLIKAYNSVMDIGRSFGSALRRIRSKNFCKL